MREGNRSSKFLFIVGVTVVLVLGTNFIHIANAQEKDSKNTDVAKSNEKTSKKNLTELSKCESDLSKDDGQLTSADVRDCYRSEERRVGKECRSRWAKWKERKK